jgi:hypothetical protein
VIEDNSVMTKKLASAFLSDGSKTCLEVENEGEAMVLEKSETEPIKDANV